MFFGSSCRRITNHQGYVRQRDESGNPIYLLQLLLLMMLQEFKVDDFGYGVLGHC